MRKVGAGLRRCEQNGRVARDNQRVLAMGGEAVIPRLHHPAVRGEESVAPTRRENWLDGGADFEAAAEGALSARVEALHPSATRNQP